MSKHLMIKVFMVLSMLLLVTGCSTTRSTGIWKDPAFSETKLTNVMVIAVSEQDSIRRLFEDEFVKQLRKKNINAVASYAMFSLDKIRDDKNAVKTQMEQKGIDGVLVTRMLDRSTEEIYYPPTVEYIGPPRIYYRGWYNYFYTGYNEFVTTPGYSETYTVVKLECNIYNVKDEKLLFSGLSDTKISRGAETNAPGIVKAIIKSIAE